MYSRRGMRLATALSLSLCLPFAGIAAPLSVTAHYKVTMNRVPVGEMHEVFDARDGMYHIVSETRAVGILALFERRPVRTTSDGTVADHGLQPLHFAGARSADDKRRVRADFDWTAHTITLFHDERIESVALPQGTQDRLSVMYQFLYLDPAGLRNYAFAMTNGRKVDHYRYSLGPDTELDTPLGRLPVIHLTKDHAPGEASTDIWLSRNHQLMPVKMRIVENDGQRFEQVIARLEIRD